MNNREIVNSDCFIAIVAEKILTKIMREMAVKQ